MEMRDLKADLELCNKIRALDGFETDDFMEFVEVERIALEYAANVREGWPHAIERALEAEALARELVAALRGVSGMLDYATRRCRCGVCEYCNAQEKADKALAKAKEVLGDE